MTRPSAIGAPNYFIKRLNPREQLIRQAQIIPLEVVCRNVAAGSLSQRLCAADRHPAAQRARSPSHWRSSAVASTSVQRDRHRRQFIAASLSPQVRIERQPFIQLHRKGVQEHGDLYVLTGRVDGVHDVLLAEVLP